MERHKHKATRITDNEGNRHFQLKENHKASTTNPKEIKIYELSEKN